MSDAPAAREVASSARAVEGLFLEGLAIHADALASGLAQSARLVAWDREQLIGAMQARVRRLAGQRMVLSSEGPVRVLERRLQPLECIDLAWEQLRIGRAVTLEYEPGSCEPAIDVLRSIALALAPGALTVAPQPGPLGDDVPGARVGVHAAGSRIALIDASADRELAAYVLARTSLRRCGADPRAVKLAYVCGAIDRLQRHLTRLWVGVSIGPATDSGSFAGPLDAGLHKHFVQACAQWSEAEGVVTWCAGAPLVRAGDRDTYAAPALYFAERPPPKLPLAGPMLVVVGCDETGARAAYDAAASTGGQVIQIGGRAGQYVGAVRHIRGALLVERLPPGLPEPRPV